MNIFMLVFMNVSRAIDWLNEKIASVVSWTLLVAVIICAGNALVRYTFNYSSNAWLEIQWYLYSAMFLLASAYTLRRDEHVRIDVVVGRFSKRTQVWLDLIGFVVFLFPVCLLVLWHGMQFAEISFLTKEMSSNAGGLIVWPAKILLPIAFFLLILQGVSEIIKRIAFLEGYSDGREFAKQVSTPQDEIDAIKAANKLD